MYSTKKFNHERRHHTPNASLYTLKHLACEIQTTLEHKLHAKATVNILKPTRLGCDEIFNKLFSTLSQVRLVIFFSPKSVDI